MAEQITHQKGGRRILALCALSFCAVLFVFAFLDYLYLDTFWAVCVSVLAALTSALCLTAFKKTCALPTGLALGAITVILFVIFALSPAQALKNREGTFVLRADSEAYIQYGSGVIDATVLSVNGKESPKSKVRLFLLDASPAPCKAGDQITVTGKSTLSRSISRISDGSFVNLSQTGDISVLPLGADNLLCKITRFSDWLGSKIRSLLPQKEGALLCALITGDREHFTDDFERALRRSGLAHIAAVSGMHVSVIMAAGALLFGKRAGLAVSLIVLPLFAAMTGFSPSVMRAVIMGALGAGAFLTKNEYDPLTSISVAAAVICAFNPFVMFSPSFLLSFGSTLGIILIGSRLAYFLQTKLPKRHPLQHILSNCAAALAVSVAATLFTLPLQLAFFSSVSLVSVISNLLAVWAVPAAMLLGMFLVPLCIAFPAAGSLLSFVAALPLRYLVQCIELMGNTLVLTAKSDNIFLILASVGFVMLALLYYIGKISGKICSLFCLLLCSLCICMSALFPTRGLYIYGEDGVCSMVLANGTKICIVNAPTSYSGRMFIQNALDGARVQTVIITNPQYKASGAINQIDSQEIYSSAPLQDTEALVYTQSGTLNLYGTNAELIHAGSSAAIRLTTPKYCLLDITALSPTQQLPALNTCDGLVINSVFASSPAILRYLCAQTKPSVVFVSGNVADISYLEQICACKVMLLDDCGSVKIY